MDATMKNSQFSSPDFDYSRWLSSPEPGEEIVISGMSGRLPESNNIEEFKNNIFNKKNLSTPDDKKWKMNNPKLPKRSAKIPNVDKFDAGFFGLYYRNVKIMDPMISKFMEVAVEAIIDSGMNPGELEGTNTGVFVGASWSDMEDTMVKGDKNPQEYLLLGYLRSLIAQRVSYYLKLKGPAFVTDTACSSSSTALAAAFRSMRNGQCENAIVGGTQLLFHPVSSIQFYQTGIVGKDGIVKTFDQDANGYARAETIACVFLQKAKNSRRIYAQIVNIKSNCDGFKEQSITFPSTLMQQQLLEEIYRESNINPDQLSYLEAHGTGTSIGDIEEVQAIDKSLAKRRTKPLLIGSVKSNAGHAEPASLFASLFKTLIALDSGLISPNINLKKINTKLTAVIEGRIHIATELTQLADEGAVVGINNFGFGGTNLHTILKRFEKKKTNKEMSYDDIPRLVCVSGRTKEAVLRIIDDINNKSFDKEYIGLLHHIFKNSIEGHLYRAFSIVSKRGPLETSVVKYYQKKPFILCFGEIKNSYKVLRSSLIKLPSFKNTFARINKILTNEKLQTIDNIFGNENKHNQDFFTSVCVQLALVDILKLLEITPEAVYGISIGKISAEYFKSVITLKEAVLLALKQIQCFEADINNNIKENVINNNENFYSSSIFENKINKKGFILDISDSLLKAKRDLNRSFIELLGRLYQNGQNLQLYKLYSDVEYPVSRSTPMISPLIQWNHEKSWPLYKFTKIHSHKYLKRKFPFATHLDDFKYTLGHIIDGRPLFPATGYLYLIWKTLAEYNSFEAEDFPVTFSNCKFYKAIPIVQNKIINFTIGIQKRTGFFEIIEKDSVVVTGQIQPFAIASLDEENCSLDNDQTKFLEQDEIYRELYLRGYNYKNMFKGLKRCHIDASKAVVQWQDNWPCFIDNLLQLSILQIDTRMLYVPIAIKKLVIDPRKHMESMQKFGQEELYPVHLHKNCDTIKSGGIEITGLTARSISKRKQRLNPVLTKYEFVPYKSNLELSEAVRVNVQIILENKMNYLLKAVEIVEENSMKDSKVLMYFISKTLDDIPLITSDLVISTKEPVEEVPGVQIKNVLLNSESKLDLIIAQNILEKPNLRNILDALNPQGFLLSREDTEFVYRHLPNLDLITEYETPKEKLVLLRKRPQDEDRKLLEVSSDNFQWLTQLQELLTNHFNVTIYCQNQTQEGILGLINCIRREPNGEKVNCFFMMDKSPEFDPQNDFYQKQFEKRLAVNVFKNNSWGTYRHLLLEEESEVQCEHSYVNILSKGDFSTLRWLEGPLSLNTPLNENETLISVHYTGINFKDIMAASGRVGVEAFTKNRFKQDCLLGFEVSGRILSGRRVSGVAPSPAISSLVSTNSRHLLEIPDAWSMEDAATVPAVYTTVIYALLIKGEMMTGNSVLIHSAAGGVGLAAINVCLYYNCEIFATVGSQEKRDYLRKNYPQIPKSHIGNSHDTSFEEMVKTQTNKRGVDLVLNSLSEEKLHASIRCLAQGGRFLELGKYDVFNDSSLHLLLLEKNASYHGIMLDQIVSSAPEIFQNILKEMRNGVEKGYVKPIPRKVFEKNQIDEAFRYMSKGKHIGKILIKIRDEEKDKLVIPKQTLFRAYPRLYCKSHFCYVIVGGLGGVGLELADWLVQRGAKNLVLSSRFGVQNGYQNYRIRLWRSYNVNITVSKADVTTKEGCSKLLKEAIELGPVNAIFNLAAVLKDALFENQTEESFRITLLPKAQATMYLDEISRQLCPDLRYFVVFSSVACGLGNAGQTNYAMANSIMERICEKRKLDGLPAVAIQWGAIGDVGLVAKMQKDNKELVIGGTLQQKISSCLEVLDKLLKQDHPIVSSMVVAQKHGTNYGELKLVEAVALVLGIGDIKTVSQHATLSELGMDSIMATEAVQVLERDFDIVMTTKEVRNLTLAQLVEIENNKQQNGDEKRDKIRRGAELIIQHIPDNRVDNSAIINLSCLINDSGIAQTVVVLPGIEGVFKPLEFLSQQMKAHVIGLNYPYQDPKDTINELGEYLFSKIETIINKNDNFVIIGYSFGAIIGVELVCILESKGYKGKLILIDGSPSYIASSAREILPDENNIALQVAVILRVLTILLPIDITMQQKEKLLKCANFEERIDRCISLVPPEIATKFNFEKQTPYVLYTRLQALLTYKFTHKKIHSQTYLFKAKYSLTKDPKDYEMASICENEVNITTIEGDHASILNQQELVDKINNILLLE